MNAHHAATRRALDDLLQAALELHGHPLGFLVVLGTQGYEHAFLHADIRLGILLLGVGASHGAVAVSPGRADLDVIGVDLLQPGGDHLLLDLGHAVDPAALGRGLLSDARRWLQAGLELLVFAGVGEPVVQQAYHHDTQEDAGDVEQRERARGVAHDQQDQGEGKREPEEVPAGPRPGGLHGQVVRRIHAVGESELIYAPELAHRHLGQHLDVPEEAAQGPLLGALLGCGKVLVVEGDLAHRFEVVAALVPAHGDVEGGQGISQAGYRLDRERLGQNSDPVGYAEAGEGPIDVVREEKRGVDGHEDVVGQDPTLLQEPGPASRPGQVSPGGICVAISHSVGTLSPGYTHSLRGGIPPSPGLTLCAPRRP
jgi:hypothetical protein